MPVLPNPRHEAFAQALAKGKSAAEAYTDAGYNPSRSAASRLSTNVNVESRVAELQGRVAKKVEVTLESITAELEEARGIAIAEKQPSAAVSASMGKAKLFGLVIDKKHHSGSIQVVTITAAQLDELTPDELSAFRTAWPVLEKLGLVGGSGSGEPA
jgi:phage terminase small subunit